MLRSAALIALLSSSASAVVIELQSTNPEELGHFGGSVAIVPDVNGDGLDDVLVGARDENGGGVSDAGRAYLFSGKDGSLIRAHSSPNDEASGDYGRSVSGIPDLNNDGRGDYIIGAPEENGDGVSNAGRAYVYSGADGALIRTHDSSNSESNGGYGWSVSGMDDLSGDGRGDYIISAYEEDNGATTDAGRVYLYSGNTGSLIRSHTSPNAESFGQFGYSVSGVPDVNNDSRDDYIVGAPQEDPGGALSNSGKAYVFSGINGAMLHSLSSGEPDSDGHFGWTVGGTRDVGGNGFGDVIVGAPHEDDGSDFFDCGFAYLYSGTSGNLAHTYEAPVIGDNDLFGYAVAGIDDLTGNGLAEVIVGAPGLGTNGYEAYVFNADTEELLETLETPDPIGVNQFWGGAVAGGGDTNGDGRGDYMVGGQGSDNFPDEPSENGRAYLYRASPFNNACSALFAVTLTDGDTFFSTVDASTSGDRPDCALVSDFGPDIWFRYEASCDGNVTFSTCSQVNFNSALAVYDGCSYTGSPFFFCNLNSLLVCDNTDLFCGSGEIVTVAAQEGECFFLRIGGINSASGTGTITVECAVPCPADLNGDNTVDGADLGLLLGAWGTNGPADINGDDTVDGADLGLLLADWGDC